MRNIYNFDEAALFYRLLQNRTYALKTERVAKGTKLPKERLTIGLCANATGTHKLPLFVIGKYHKPRCFSSLAEIREMPVKYTANTKA